MKRFWPGGLGLLVFLCASDKGFAFRVSTFNVRLGQLLLFGVVMGVALLSRTARAAIVEVIRSRFFRHAVPFFACFAVAYAFSGILSVHPFHQFLKLGWILANVAAAFCLGVIARHFGVARAGLRIGIALIAAVILIDWALLYWVHTQTTLGFFERSYPFLGASILRPKGFFYEPSYASGCLAMATLFAVAMRWKEAPVLALTVLLVGSRSGMVTVAFGMVLFCVLCFSSAHRSLRRAIFEFSGVLVLLLGLLWVTPGGNRYLRFLAGPMGVAGIEYPLNRHFHTLRGEATPVPDPFLKEQCQGGFDEFCKVWAAKNPKPGDPIIPMSEGERLSSIIFALKKWSQKPIFGHGVPVDSNGRLAIDSQSIWLELLVDSGAVGFVLFFLTLVSLWHQFLKREGWTGFAVFVPFLAHIIVTMNFTQSIARLDYWILYFLGLQTLIFGQKGVIRLR